MNIIQFIQISTKRDNYDPNVFVHLVARELLLTVHLSYRTQYRQGSHLKRLLF